MSSTSEDQRLTLANMHALALVALRAPDAAKHRAFLDALADYAPEPEVLSASDPRSDAALGAGAADAAAARRLAARLRGMVLGVAPHQDTAAKELSALAREAAGGEAGVADAEVARRASVALAKTREDLARDVVRLGDADALPARPGPEVGDRLRRWGGVRSLELNAFVAAFTRDGTHPAATTATREGRNAGALRFALAVAQAGLSLAREREVDGDLLDDARRVDAALPALLAELLGAVRGAKPGP